MSENMKKFLLICQKFYLNYLKYVIFKIEILVTFWNSVISAEQRKKGHVTKLDFLL